MSGPYKLTRNELAQFLPSPRAIRAFEQLFEVGTTDLNQIIQEIANLTIALALLSDKTDEVDTSAGNAGARAQMAVSAISRLADAVELLALAPVRPPQTQVVDITPPTVIQQTNGNILPPVFEQNKRKRYGAFQSNVTQTAAVINTAYGMTFDGIDLSFGVTVGTPTSRIYLDTEGIYNIQFSAQLLKTSGGIGLVYVWLRVNGIDVPASAGKIRIQGNNAEVVVAWNYVYQFGLGDYFELMWSTDSTACQIQASAAAPPAPSIPSIILTVTDNIS
jgi:hypothetical protein